MKIIFDYSGGGSLHYDARADNGFAGLVDDGPEIMSF